MENRDIVKTDCGYIGAVLSSAQSLRLAQSVARLGLRSGVRRFDFWVIISLAVSYW